ncbi:MAG: cupin-like domain-containing protein [Gammaproteobacteria bacterium]|nr:cupin-like domain-containing protein [Gammaproteobacteria bacterium]
MSERKWNNLGQLIQPTETKTFFSDYWEIQPLHVPHEDPAYFRNLFQLTDMDKLLQLGNRTFAAEDPTRSKVVRCHPTHRLFDPRRNSEHARTLSDLYRHGHTILIDDIHTQWPAIAELTNELARELGHGVGANLYLTPKQSQGFGIHYDTHDVFILQIEGHKEWRIYDIEVSLPLPEMQSKKGNLDPNSIGEPKQKLTLNAGDVLYIPRGHAHAARTTNSHSLHLTVGVHVVCWVDLLKAAISQVALHDVRLRRALPIDYFESRSVRNDEAIQRQLMRYLALVSASANVSEVNRLLADSPLLFLSQQNANRFGAIEALDTVGEETVVTRSPLLQCHVVEEGEKVTFVFPAGEIRGPLKIAAACHFIASTQRFTVGELPGVLSPAAKTVLVKRFIREGILHIAPASIDLVDP